MNLERLILEKLSLVHPRMLRMQTLHSDMRMDLPDISLTDLKRHVSNLEGKTQVIVLNNDDGTRVKISTDGLARLAE